MDYAEAKQPLAIRSIGDRLPIALQEQQRAVTSLSSVDDTSEYSEDVLTSARKQLRSLVGQLREVVAEQPDAMHARLRDHGLELV